MSHPTNDLSLDVTTVSADATGAIIQVRGDLDVAHCQLLAAVLDNHLQLGHRFVRLDLSQLEILDGSGLRAIVAAHNQFLAARGNLILTNIGPMVVRLLSLTELDQALLIADGPDYSTRFFCVARSGFFVRAGRRWPTSPPFNGALPRIRCPTPVAW
jgi:anti-anti-sigma factor